MDVHGYFVWFGLVAGAACLVTAILGLATARDRDRMIARILMSTGLVVMAGSFWLRALAEPLRGPEHAWLYWHIFQWGVVIGFVGAAVTASGVILFSIRGKQ